MSEAPSEAVALTGPRISVVIPVYAAAAYLDEMVQRLRSIREDNEILPAFLLHEAIFICDEPIDASEAILRRQAERYDWVKVFSLTRNGGQHLATAVGITRTTGDWILTLDEDLQHPPELIRDVLIHALRSGFDLVYIRSTTRIHLEARYRDWSSRTSKALMKLVTNEDYSILSSFRLIRGDVARHVLAAIDRKSYLDAVLMYHTSPRRRGVYYGEFQDRRNRDGSGYSFKKLIRHYGKLLLSVEISGLRLVVSIAVAFGALLVALSAGYLLIAWKTNVYQQTPGWMSLFLLGVMTNILILLLITYIIKTVSVLWQRSSGSPTYLLVDRTVDASHQAVLQHFVEKSLR